MSSTWEVSSLDELKFHARAMRAGDYIFFALPVGTFLYCPDGASIVNAKYLINIKTQDKDDLILGLVHNKTGDETTLRFNYEELPVLQPRKHVFRTSSQFHEALKEGIVHLGDTIIFKYIALSTTSGMSQSINLEDVSCQVTDVVVTENSDSRVHLCLTHEANTYKLSIKKDYAHHIKKLPTAFDGIHESDNEEAFEEYYYCEARDFGLMPEGDVDGCGVFMHLREYNEVFPNAGEEAILCYKHRQAYKLKHDWGGVREYHGEILPGLEPTLWCEAHDVELGECDVYMDLNAYKKTFGIKGKTFGVWATLENATLCAKHRKARVLKLMSRRPESGVCYIKDIEPVACLDGKPICKCDEEPKVNDKPVREIFLTIRLSDDRQVSIRSDSIIKIEANQGEYAKVVCECVSVTGQRAETVFVTAEDIHELTHRLNKAFS